MRVVAISDTHGYHDGLVIPPCDLLIHAGDASWMGRVDELVPFIRWLGEQRAETKVFVPGNHDWGFDNIDRDLLLEECKESGVTCLIHEDVMVRGVRIFGTPYQPNFGVWAFNRDDAWREGANTIIPECDILVSHAPPQGILDEVPGKGSVGDIHLRTTAIDVGAKYHIFGHIHEGYGVLAQNGVTYVNASICTAGYNPKNTPILLHI